MNANMVSNCIYSHHGIHIKEGMADLKWKYFNNIDHQSLTNCKLEPFIMTLHHTRDCTMTDKISCEKNEIILGFDIQQLVMQGLLWFGLEVN